MTELHFREWKTPAGFATSAVIPEKLSCGIYELSFTNGELYIGQTINFPARFSTHRRRWGDIEAVRFAEAIPKELDDKERAAIQSRVEQKRQLRNKTLLSQSAGPSPLDLIVDPQAQAAWLQHDADSEPPGVDPERVTLAQRRVKSRVKFDKLRDHAEFSALMESVSAYVSQVIVWPQETEGRQWTLTALPSTARHKVNRRLAALSIHNVEVLVFGEMFWEDTSAWETYTFMNTAIMSVVPQEIQDLTELTAGYRSTGTVHRVSTAGLHAIPPLLEIPEVLRAARQLAMGQLRKGSSVLARHHNDSLADEVFAAMDL